MKFAYLIAALLVCFFSSALSHATPLDQALARAYRFYDQAGIQYDAIRFDPTEAESIKSAQFTTHLGRTLAAFMVAHDLAKQAMTEANTTEKQREIHSILEKNYWRMNTILNEWLVLGIRKNARFRYLSQTGISLETIEETRHGNIAFTWIMNLATVAVTLALAKQGTLHPPELITLPVISLMIANYKLSKTRKSLDPKLEEATLAVNQISETVAFKDFYSGFEAEFKNTDLLAHGEGEEPKGYTDWAQKLNAALDDDRKCWKYLSEPAPLPETSWPTFPYR